MKFHDLAKYVLKIFLFGIICCCFQFVSRRAVRLEVGYRLALWQGRPVLSPPYLTPLRLSSGHWPLYGKRKARAFPGLFLICCDLDILHSSTSQLLIDSSPRIHLIYLSGRPGAGAPYFSYRSPRRATQAFGICLAGKVNFDPCYSKLKFSFSCCYGSRRLPRKGVGAVVFSRKLYHVIHSYETG